MGGIFNHINGNLYHYAGNNPVKYTDPDGKTQIPILGNYLMQDSEWRNVKINGDSVTIGIGGCAIIATADMLGITPKEVNEKYVVDGEVSWETIATKNGFNTTGRVDGPFTKKMFDKQNDDKSNEYRTFVNVNYDDDNHEHYVGLKGFISINGNDYVVISPTSINDKMTTYDSWYYYDNVKGNCYYPQSRADKGWIINKGSICVPVDQIKAYVNFTKEQPNE